MDLQPPAIDITTAVRFPGLLYGLAVLVLAWFAARALKGTLTQLGDRFTNKRLLLNQGATVGRFLVWLVGITAAVALSLNLSREIVIALTGTAAVTIGFALKDLAASVIAGVIIIFDRPFQVGDRVSFAGTYGEISAIGLRSVHMVTLDDNVVTIPNNKFLTDVVSSGNWGALDMLIQMDFFVGADQDVALAKKLVERAVVSTRYAYLNKPWTVLVSTLLEGSQVAVRLRAKVYVLDVKYEKQLETDVTERVLESFRARGIQPPAILHRSAA